MGRCDIRDEPELPVVPFSFGEPNPSELLEPVSFVLTFLSVPMNERLRVALAALPIDSASSSGSSSKFSDVNDLRECVSMRRVSDSVSEV